MRKVLLVFTGLIDSPLGNWGPWPKQQHNGTHYLIPCYESIKKNIIDANKDYTVDTLFYCWGSDNNLISQINDIYKPVKSKFTQENLENRFFSKMKGNKLAWGLAKTLDTIHEYKYIMFLRPDIIFFKPIHFDSYKYTDIYHNDGRPDQHGHYGDFYFLMNKENAEYFASFFDMYYEQYKESVWTENTFRNVYLPLLSKYLSDRTTVLNNLRAGDAREIEVFRKT
jgi:hypothetical protein